MGEKQRRGMLSFWMLAFGSLALAPCGCASINEYLRKGLKVGPDYVPPAAPVAEDWIDADDRRVRTESPDLSRWWSVFGDPALAALIQGAYEQNLTLREAGARVLEARARYGITVGNLFPQQQEAVGAYQRTGVSVEVANRVATPERFFSVWDYGFALAWELDFWGRFRRAVEAADADLGASVDEYDDVLVTLLADVARDYTLLRTLQEEIRLAQNNVKLQRQTLAIAEARFESGQSSELDVDQAKSVLGQTESVVPQLQIRLREVNNRLCVLLGIPPEELSEMLGSAPIPSAPPEIAVGVPAELLTRRPDVRRAERLAAAQSARIGIAESEFYPHITITGSLGYAADDLRDLFNADALFGAVGPSFRWNLFNYGRIANDVRLQDARFSELVTSYQNTVLRAAAEVEDGLAVFLRSQRRARSLAESVDAAEKAVNVALAQYKGGLVDFNRVALLEQNLVEQQDLLAQARGDIALGLIETYRALGGGWQIRCAPVATGPAPAEAPSEMTAALIDVEAEGRPAQEGKAAPEGEAPAEAAP